MILFLNASPRTTGVSTSILRAMADAVGRDGGVEWVDVNDLTMKPCIGCMQCRPDKVCVLPRDDAHRIGEMIAECSSLVVGSPTYWGNIPGPLKTLFDRNVPVLEHVVPGALPKPKHKGKSAILVTAANAPAPFHRLGSQSGGTVRALKTILRGAGFSIAGTIAVPSAIRFEGVRKDRIRGKASALAQRVLR